MALTKIAMVDIPPLSLLPFPGRQRLIKKASKGNSTAAKA